MNQYISIFLVIFACAVVLYFNLNNNIEKFSINKGTGYCGPDWNKFNKHEFVKKRCIPNMNPNDCENFTKTGVKCGANFDNWEQYDCVYNPGDMSPKCENNNN